MFMQKDDCFKENGSSGKIKKKTNGKEFSKPLSTISKFNKIQNEIWYFFYVTVARDANPLREKHSSSHLHFIC